MGDGRYPSYFIGLSKSPAEQGDNMSYFRETSFSSTRALYRANPASKSAIKSSTSSNPTVNTNQSAFKVRIGDRA